MINNPGALLAFKSYMMPLITHDDHNDVDMSIG